MISLMVLFFLIFTLLISSMVFKEPIRRFSRASEEYTMVSPTQSTVFFWPQVVSADGVSESTVKIFLLSKNNTPITNKRVRLVTTLGEMVKGEQSAPVEGKKYYEFRVKSNEVGTAVLTVTTDDSVQLQQKPSIQFTK